MRLPFLRSKDSAARGQRASVADEASAVDAARTRARRRLSGALVLLLAGVIGFPLLFETQPRPLPVDTPIEVPNRDGAAAPAPGPLRQPAPPPDAGTEMPGDAASTATTESTRPSSPPEATPAEAASTSAAEAATQAAAEATPAAPAPRPPAPTAAAARNEPTDDGARARALLEGAAAPAARFVVQVGAYSDEATLRQARQRVEKLGLKTYIQVINTAAGKRTRVRIGPFASRQDADAAAAKVKAAGMPANILVL